MSNNHQKTKRIAIVGAGICGITSAKACVEQNFEPVVFEKTTYTCGLWRYQPHLDEDGIASVMKSTIINTSKEISALSDFPPPIEYPNFMHNSKMARYFEMYGESFGFNNYVRFRHEILQLELADDYDVTGRWKVTFRNLDTGEESTEIFDGVMICTGHHSLFYMPKLKDQDKFKGTIIHTHSLKHGIPFADKKVVIVGIGNSGGDAAVELGQLAKQVYLSTRRGTWVNKRVGVNGMPYDSQLLRRILSCAMKIFPYDFICSFIESKLNSIMDHDKYQLKPKHRVFSQHIMINDALPNRILSGTVIIKPDIDRFVENGVIFKGETEVTECDAVIMATGYRISYPFLSQELLPVVNNSIRLYKFQFIPHLKQPHTLAFIGLIQPIGPIFPIAELQARWFAQLMLGNVKPLPSREVMDADIDRRLNLMKKRYYGSNRHTIQVDYIPFMDELAAEVGVSPPIWKYFFTDPKLFWALMFGPSCAYQYRLVGPNSWKGARDAQLGIIKRMEYGLKTNKVYEKENQSKSCQKCSSTNFLIQIGVLIGFLILIYGLFTRYF